MRKVGIGMRSRRDCVFEGMTFTRSRSRPVSSDVWEHSRGFILLHFRFGRWQAICTNCCLTAIACAVYAEEILELLSRCYMAIGLGTFLGGERYS